MTITILGYEYPVPPGWEPAAYEAAFRAEMAKIEPPRVRVDETYRGEEWDEEYWRRMECAS